MTQETIPYPEPGDLTAEVRWHIQVAHEEAERSRQEAEDFESALWRLIREDADRPDEPTCCHCGFVAGARDRGDLTEYEPGRFAHHECWDEITEAAG